MSLQSPRSRQRRKRRTVPIIDRNLAEPLRRRLRHYPVVTVTGPRQSGKTTLCRTVLPDRPYVSLEGLDVRTYAREDPRGFLREYRDGAVIDEVQRAPDLTSYLQGEVDEDPTPGRFVLTGVAAFRISRRGEPVARGARRRPVPAAAGIRRTGALRRAASESTGDAVDGRVSADPRPRHPGGHLAARLRDDLCGARCPVPQERHRPRCVLHLCETGGGTDGDGDEPVGAGRRCRRSTQHGPVLAVGPRGEFPRLSDPGVPSERAQAPDQGAQAPLSGYPGWPATCSASARPRNSAITR